MSETRRTSDGFVMAFPPVSGEAPFAPAPVVEACKKGVDLRRAGRAAFED